MLSWRNGCQADRPARKGGVYLEYHGRNLQKESVYSKMIRKNFLNKAAKNGFSLGSMFLVDLQLSVWIIQYVIFT